MRQEGSSSCIDGFFSGEKVNFYLNIRKRVKGLLCFPIITRLEKYFSCCSNIFSIVPLCDSNRHASGIKKGNHEHKTMALLD